MFTSELIPSQVDYSTIMRWLEYYTAHHKRLCGTDGHKLPGLKLIDCSTLSMIEAPPSAQYAALSYVWDQCSLNSGDRNVATVNGVQVLPQILPAVISDAITVTPSLGLAYLWVDKFCIDQNNPNEIHDQISRMDDVYREAKITIVAAAGEDENFGLPGVNHQPRNIQPKTQIGPLRIVSSMPHPHYRIMSSRWWTRGWTYQEAALSRRRLVFTEDHVYFECKAMNCCESLTPNLDLTQTKSKSKSLRFLHSDIFSGKQDIAFGAADTENLSRLANLGIYLGHVCQYTARNLTYDSDSLKTFMGIIRQASQAKSPVLQVWGGALPRPSSV
jgi:hypothetical protein